MRIALLVEKYPPDPGGLGLSAQRLARSLTGAGHHVHVLAPTDQLAPSQTTLTDQAGVAVQRFGPQHRLDDTLADWFAALVAAHQAQPFDVVHGYFIHQAGFVAAYAGRYLGLPSIASARGNDLDKAIFEPGKAAHAFYALTHAGAVTGNSRDLARKAAALAPGRTVDLIPNGVDTTRFAPAPRDAALAAAFGLDERPVIGFVGEARAKKGLVTLLLAFRDLAAAQPAQLLLLGGVRSDDKDNVKVFRKQHPDLTVRVIPYELEKDMAACYNLLDVLALPSLRDGLPNALLEGMACGCAVVGAIAGGLPDALRDGENGRLVPPGDPVALTAALAALLADPAERARLGAQARATVQQDFTPERELALNLALYQRLLDAPD